MNRHEKDEYGLEPFIAELNNVTVDLGDSVEFKCSVRDDYVSSISWIFYPKYQNQKEKGSIKFWRNSFQALSIPFYKELESPNDHIQLFRNEDYEIDPNTRIHAAEDSNIFTERIIIKNVTRNDYGRYICAFHNEHAVRLSVGTLTFIPKH